MTSTVSTARRSGTFPVAFTARVSATKWTSAWGAATQLASSKAAFDAVTSVKSATGSTLVITTTGASAPSTTSSNGEDSNGALILGIIGGAVVVCVAAFCIGWGYYRSGSAPGKAEDLKHCQPGVPPNDTNGIDIEMNQITPEFDDLVGRGQEWSDSRDAGITLSAVCDGLSTVAEGIPLVGGVLSVFCAGCRVLGEQMAQLSDNADDVAAAVRQLKPFSQVCAVVSDTGWPR